MSAGLALVADDARLTVPALVARCARRSGAEAESAAGRVAELEKELAAMSRKQRAAERSARAKAVLPDAAVVDKVIRYEAHLSRQLTQALHLLSGCNWRGPAPRPPRRSSST